MNQGPQDLERQYRTALEKYLKEAGEAALSYAYELGRAAIGQGLGILDIAAMHEDAVDAFLPAEVKGNSSRFTQAANHFFHEGLSPFEMTFRGYRQANAELRRLNEALSLQEEELERINHELESFSYSVSHDLRAPLRAIDGFSEALLEDCADRLTDDGKQHLHRIRQAAQRMGRLIEDLLSLARLNQGELRRMRVDLSALVRRIVERFRLADPSRQAEFAIEDGVVAHGDPGLLAVLLENLLGNAWKFTSKREVAKIEFGQLRDEARMAYFVRDNGAGFDTAYSKKLFGPFQRLHSASEFEGTGIGLATVQRVVHRHGGQAWAQGKVDGGATFYFTLAAASARQEGEGSGTV